MSAAPTTPSFSSSSPARSLHSLGYSVSSETPPHLTGKKTEARQTEGLPGPLKHQPQDLAVLWGLTSVSPGAPPPCIIL